MPFTFNNTLPSNFPTRPSASTIPGRTVFPSDLITNDRNFYTAIQFVKWTTGLAGASILGNGNIVTPTSGIILPLPKQINEIQVMNWEEKSAVDAAANMASYASSREVSAKRKDVMDKVVGLAASAAPLLAYGAGETYNPFLYMMFQSPRFKTHKLEWIFAPKSKAESDTINDIVNQIKKKSLPTIDYGAMFGFPEIAMVKLYPDSHLLKFRPCAVTSVAINYTPTGGPSFFKSGAPAAVSLSIELKEIELTTQNNYDGPSSGVATGIFNAIARLF